MALLSDSAFSALRISLEITLTHRCTLTTISAGAEDGHGDAAPAAGTVTTGVPCRYETVQRAVRDQSGVTLVSVPTLTVSATLAIAIGAQVTAVTDQLGTVMAAGPLRVERVLDDTAGLGSAILPVFELRSIDTELT